MSQPSPADALVQLPLTKSDENLAIAQINPPVIDASEISLLMAANSNPNGNTPMTVQEIEEASKKRARNNHQTARRQQKKQRTRMTEHINKNLGFKKEYFEILGKEVTANLTIQLEGLSTGSIKQIRSSHVQQVLLWVFRMCTYCPEWFQLKHRPLVDNAVVLILDGLTQSIVEKHYDLLTILHPQNSNHVEQMIESTENEAKLTQNTAGIIEKPAEIKEVPKKHSNSYINFLSAASMYVNIQAAQHLLQCSVQKIFGYKRNQRVGKINLYDEETMTNPNLVSKPNEGSDSKNTKKTAKNAVNDLKTDGQHTYQDYATKQVPNASKITLDLKNTEHHKMDFIVNQFKSHLKVKDIEMYSATADDLLIFDFPLPSNYSKNLDDNEKSDLIVSSSSSGSDSDLPPEFTTFKHTLPLSEANVIRLSLYEKYPQLFKKPAPLVDGGELLILESSASSIPIGYKTVVTEKAESAENKTNITEITSEEVVVFGKPSKSILDCPSTGSFPFLDLIHPETPAYYTMLALDCEMVVGPNDLRMLARISVIDVDGHVLLDTLVQPIAPVIDYVTQWSGVSALDFDPENNGGKTIITYPEAQEIMLGLLSSQHFLVGHGLENDLKVMRLTHTNVLDTTMLFPHRKGGKIRNSLRYLTQQYLKEIIQQGDHGHDSIVDALSALKLAMKKMVFGPKYGVQNVHSLLEVFDYFNITSHLLSTPEVCRRLSSAKTNCIVRDIRKIDPLLNWAAHFLQNKAKQHQLAELSMSDSDSSDSDGSDFDDESSMGDPISNEKLEKGTSEQESSQLAIDQDEKNCVILHSSEFLESIEAKWERHVLDFYCIPMDHDEEARYALDHATKMDHLNQSVQAHIETYLAKDGEEGEETPATSKTTQFEKKEEISTITAPTSHTAIIDETNPIAAAEKKAEEVEEKPKPRLVPPHITPPIPAYSKFRGVENLKTSQPIEPDFAAEVSTLNNKLIQFHSQLPPNTLLVLASGQGSTILPRFLGHAADELKKNTNVIQSFNTLPKEFNRYISERITKEAQAEMKRAEKAGASTTIVTEGTEDNSNTETGDPEIKNAIQIVVNERDTFMHNPKYLTQEEKLEFVTKMREVAGELERSSKSLSLQAARGIVYFNVKQ